MGYKTFDLTVGSSEELVELLSHKNRWFRQKALQVIRDRGDISILPGLEKIMRSEKGEIALEAFWAIHLLGGMDDGIAIDIF